MMKGTRRPSTSPPRPPPTHLADNVPGHNVSINAEEMRIGFMAPLRRRLTVWGLVIYPENHPPHTTPTQSVWELMSWEE